VSRRKNRRKYQVNLFHTAFQGGAATVAASAYAAMSPEDAFSPLELDFFKRAEELYASVFELEPEPA
jgi:hypothetical protein